MGSTEIKVRCTGYLGQMPTKLGKTGNNIGGGDEFNGFDDIKTDFAAFESFVGDNIFRNRISDDSLRKVNLLLSPHYQTVIAAYRIVHGSSSE